MIIKLKGADFSANNLGQINVRELNDFTKSAITASSNTAMTEVQKYALDDFFYNIGAFGSKNNIYAKVKLLALPIIANGIDGAKVNFKNNISLPLSDNWTLDDYGIKAISETPRIAVTLPESISQDNVTIVSAISYDLLKAAGASQTTNLIVVGNTNPGRFYASAITNSSGVVSIYAQRDAGTNIISPVTLPNSNAFCVTLSASESYTISDNGVVDRDAVFSSSNLSSNTIYPFANLTKNSLYPVRFLFVSEALTKEEALEVKAAYDTLQSYFM